MQPFRGSSACITISSSRSGRICKPPAAAPPRTIPNLEIHQLGHDKFLLTASKSPMATPYLSAVHAGKYSRLLLYDTMSKSGNSNVRTTFRRAFSLSFRHLGNIHSLLRAQYSTVPGYTYNAASPLLKTRENYRSISLNSHFQTKLAFKTR